ncbi:MAG: hypothetical protein KGI08_08240 [Thaumarchaeota archaeon]|nr:hypothetical protein [Nitrososphaerota archaeon]
MRKTVNQTVAQHFGLMTWIWLVVGAIFSLFSFLANLHNDTQFKAAQVFTDLYLFSFILLITLPQFDRFRTKLTGDDGEKNFWLQDLTFHKLIYVPLGFILVLVSAYIALLGGQPIVGIFVSGMIMLTIFYRTHSILIPIFIHGMYNSFVVLVQSGLIGNSVIPANITTSALGVPIIGVSISGLSALSSEIIFQNVLVATSEELFKMMVIAFVVVNLRGGFNAGKGSRWFAGFIAVVAWAVLHIITQGTS